MSRSRFEEGATAVTGDRLERLRTLLLVLDQEQVVFLQLPVDLAQLPRLLSCVGNASAAATLVLQASTWVLT